MIVSNFYIYTYTVFLHKFAEIDRIIVAATLSFQIELEVTIYKVTNSNNDSCKFYCFVWGYKGKNSIKFGR